MPDGPGRRLAGSNETNTTNVTKSVYSSGADIIYKGQSNDVSTPLEDVFRSPEFSEQLAPGSLVSDVEENPWPSAMPSVSMAPSISSMPSSSPSQSAAPSLSFEPSDLPSSGPSALPSVEPSSMPSSLPSISQMPSLSVMPSQSPTTSAAPSDCGENHAFLVAEAERLSSEASTLYDQAAELECSPSSAPSAEPSGAPTMEATISSMPSGAPSAMPTVIACGEVLDEANCTSLVYCEWVAGNVTSTTRMLRQGRTRRRRDGGDDTPVNTPPLDRADDGVCQPKPIPPRNDDDSPSAAPSSSPTPQCDCECSTKSSSTKSTTKSKSKSSKSKSSTITFPITLTRNRRRRRRTKKSSKKNSRRLGRDVGQTTLESTDGVREQDRITQLEREYFESADFDIDLETATVEEKYEALLIAFSTGNVENGERNRDANEEEGDDGDDISIER